MLTDKVLAFIREQQMFGDGDLVLVGVSGGADSLCLAHLLLSLRDTLNIRLHVAHLDHGLRAESAEDATFVAGTVSRWGLPCTVEAQDVAGFRARRRISLEEAARQVRYAYFGRLCRELGATGVTVGHTADDQVESIILHWIRGSGLAGLRGMLPAARISVPGLGETVTAFRPLLSVKRAETEAYCAGAGIEPKADASNLSLRFLRNRIRHRLLPMLELFNPNVRETLLRMARVTGRDYSFIEGEVRRVWPDVVSEAPDALSIDVASALALPPAILLHLLRLCVEQVAGSLAGLELVHLEEMASALHKPAGAMLTLPRGLVMAVGYGSCSISIGHVRSPLPPIDVAVCLSVPGETILPGWRVEAQVQEHGPWSIEEGRWSAIVDLDGAGDRLEVRPRRAGDRFQPLGMAQEKSLQDFFVDARVPRSWRDRVPIVVAPAQIVWVAGWRIDDRVKITGNTRRALRLRFTSIPEA